MTERKKTDFIVVHCSATHPGMDIGADKIREWHVRERGWKDIGYALVIRRNGVTEQGRGISAVGAHVAGYNDRSVGICLVGGINRKGRPENNFTPEQFATLKRELRALRTMYPNALIVGHNELDPKKACPSFNVQEWLKTVII